MNKPPIHPSSFIPHRSQEAYDAFAYAYDKALGARFFRAVRPLVARMLRKYAASERTHLDVACGTGMVVEYFRSQGWRSAGIDASLPMLQLARSRAHTLAAGDFRALPLRGTFGCLTCLYDSLNHIASRGDLVTVFAEMCRLMRDDSILLFDVNHPAAYREVWASAEPYVSRGADHRLEMTTMFRRRDSLARAVVKGWAVYRGERIEIDERREQRAWTERDVTAALREAGLDQVERVEFNPFRGQGGSTPLKLVFVCRRLRSGSMRARSAR